MKKVIAFYLFLSLFLTPKSYSIMMPIKFSELIQGSEYIIMGEVMKKESKVREEKAGVHDIYTDVTVHLCYVGIIKGISDLKEFVVRVEGGTLPGGGGVWVEDQPEFELGETVLLFLKKDKPDSNEVFRVYGSFQGKYTITKYCEYFILNDLLYIPMDPILRTIQAVLKAPKKSKYLDEYIEKKFPALVSKYRTEISDLTAELLKEIEK